MSGPADPSAGRALNANQAPSAEKPAPRPTIVMSVMIANGVAVDGADGIDGRNVVGERSVVADVEPANLAGTHGDGGGCGVQTRELALPGMPRSLVDPEVTQEAARQGGCDEDHGHDGERAHGPDRRPRPTCSRC